MNLTTGQKFALTLVGIIWLSLCITLIVVGGDIPIVVSCGAVTIILGLVATIISAYSAGDDFDENESW